MDWADALNGGFEVIGGLLVWKSVARLWRDRQMRGIYWPSWFFFAGWGWWNLFYYGPRLGQWLSWGGGLFMVLANTTWVVLAIRYRKN